MDGSSVQLTSGGAQEKGTLQIPFMSENSNGIVHLKGETEYAGGAVDGSITMYAMLDPSS